MATLSEQKVQEKYQKISTPSLPSPFCPQKQIFFLTILKTLLHFLLAYSTVDNKHHAMEEGNYSGGAKATLATSEVCTFLLLLFGTKRWNVSTEKWGTSHRKQWVRTLGVSAQLCTASQSQGHFDPDKTFCRQPILIPMFAVTKFHKPAGLQPQILVFSQP